VIRGLPEAALFAPALALRGDLLVPLTVFPVHLPGKNPSLDVEKSVYEAFVAA